MDFLKIIWKTTQPFLSWARVLGFNIAELGQKYPHSTLHGLDWAAPAVAIIEALRTTKGLNAHGHLFDFFHPDPNLVVPEGSAFYSLGAFEQIGTSWQ